MYNELFKGTLSTVILKLLEDNGDMYGYQITQKVTELSDGEINVKEGSLYPALHRLENERFISSYFEKIGGRKRKYYRLTQKGEEVTITKVSEFAQFVSVINKILIPNQT